MIDTHIHVVPGVDDGADSVETSLAMIRIALSEGVTEMVVTPHYNVPSFDSDRIEEQFEVLLKAVELAGLEIALHLGNEIHVNEASIERIGLKEEGNEEKHYGRTLGDSKYLLLELPYHHYYPFHEAMLFEAQMKGYKVLLAHVERFRVFREDEGKLSDLIRKGMYGQMTSRYIVERKTRARALRWIELGYIHVVASDGHNTDSRAPRMRAAYDVVAKRFGVKCAEALFTENPRRLIEDQALILPEIQKKSLAKMFGILGSRIK